MRKQKLGGRLRIRLRRNVEKRTERTRGENDEQGKNVFENIRTALFVVINRKRQEEQSYLFHPLTEYEKEVELPDSVEYVIIGNRERKYERDCKDKPRDGF